MLSLELLIPVACCFSSPNDDRSWVYDCSLQLTSTCLWRHKHNRHTLSPPSFEAYLFISFFEGISSRRSYRTYMLACPACCNHCYLRQFFKYWPLLTLISLQSVREKKKLLSLLKLSLFSAYFSHLAPSSLFVSTSKCTNIFQYTSLVTFTTKKVEILIYNYLFIFSVCV